MIVYERWDRRDNPRWFDLQLTLVVDRGAGRAPLPPRVVIVTNITVVNNIVAPGRTVMVARGEKVTVLNAAARAQVRENARIVHQTLAADRLKHEAHAAGPPARPQASPVSVRPTTATGAHAPITGVASNPAASKVGATEPGKGASASATSPQLDKKEHDTHAAGKGHQELRAAVHAEEEDAVTSRFNQAAQTTEGNPLRFFY